MGECDSEDADGDDWLEDETDEELIEYVESIRQKKEISERLREVLCGGVAGGMATDSEDAGRERCRLCNVIRPTNQMEDKEWMWAPGHYAPGPICRWHMERADPNFFKTYATDD